MQTDLTASSNIRCRKHRSAPALALHLFLAAAFFVQAMPLSTPAQAASKHVDKREVDARQAFAAGKYQEALDLYAQLYADNVHPTYLRNIGRCYQNLQQPNKAINAFRDYLRQAKGVGAAERSEIDGYIAEMEAMSLKAILDSNGIPAFVVGGSMMPNLPVQVRVASADEERAKAVIAEATAAGPEAADEAELQTETPA